MAPELKAALETWRDMDPFVRVGMLRDWDADYKYRYPVTVLRKYYVLVGQGPLPSLSPICSNCARGDVYHSFAENPWKCLFGPYNFKWAGDV